MLVERAFGVFDGDGELFHVPCLEAFFSEETACVVEDEFLAGFEIAFLAEGGDGWCHGDMGWERGVGMGASGFLTSGHLMEKLGVSGEVWMKNGLTEEGGGGREWGEMKEDR